MSKLVKNRSKGIQRAHIRRYGAGKVAVVNRGNVKKNVVSRPVRVVSRGDLRNAAKSTIYFNKRGVVDKRKFVVSDDLILKSPEALWREIKKRDRFGIMDLFNNNMSSFKKILHTYYLSFGFSSKKNGVDEMLDWFRFHSSGAQRHYLFGDNASVNVVYKNGVRSYTNIHSDFIDPFNGGLFLKDRLDMSLSKNFISEEVDYAWDKNKWMAIELNKMNTTKDGRDLRGNDKVLFDFLLNSKIPFVHSIDNSTKKRSNYFFIPREFSLRVFTQLSLPHVENYFKKVDMLDADLNANINSVKRELSLPVNFSVADYKEVFK